MSRIRYGLVTVSFGLIAALNFQSVSGQDYPNKPIRILTSTAGGGTDFNARQVARGLSDKLGQSLIVDNRAGAFTALEIVSKAPPDGYTLLVEARSFWLTPLMEKTSYDVVRDFSPISLLSSAPYVLVVHPSMSAKSVKELIDLAKAKPGQLNYASAGTGGASHLAGALFASMASIDIVHIPYKGSTPAVTDLLGNRVQLMLANPATATPHTKSGRLRGLAVTSKQPTMLVPGLPTVAATGVPGYEYETLAGTFAPAKTPTVVINRLNQETVRYLRTSEAKEQFFNSGIEIVGSSTDEFAATIKVDIVKWGKVIKEANIRTD